MDLSAIQSDFDIISRLKGFFTFDEFKVFQALFPCFLALGMIARNRYLDRSIRWTFAALGGIAAMYFFSNHWVA